MLLQLTAGRCPLRLLQLQQSVLSPDSELPDELLYGRAGYLYALLYVNREVAADSVDQDTITKVTPTSTLHQLVFTSSCVETLQLSSA